MTRTLFLLLACILAPLSAAMARTPCDLPLPSAADTPALPAVAAALRAGTLDILVVGSATVVGPARAPQDAFPEAMADTLRTRQPGLTVRLTVNGVRGQTAAAMLAVLRQNLTAAHFQLVVWQTGTVEAVRRVAPATFAATLADGMRAVHAAGADLVMVDPQYSRMLDSKADLPPYRAAIQAMTATPGTALLDRYGLMRGWSQQGLLDLEHTPVAARPKVSARLHACLGEMLARRLLAGAAR